ncbi:MAG: ornithine carbamoyltransferase [Methanomicrobiales archaeon]
MKHLLSFLDARKEAYKILKLSERFKKGQISGKPLKDKTLAMVFEKSSTRTRISFEVGMYQLGGKALYLSTNDLQIGRGEIIPDTAKAMSRYVDAVMIRAIKHKDVIEFSQNSEVPVINGLTNKEHPCQAFADVLTILEYKNTLKVHLAFLGDGNNVCNSLLLASAIFGMDMTVICPSGYEPESEIIKLARHYAQATGSKIKITEDIEDIKGADVVYTDVWVSMGDEKQESQRLHDLKGYQVNKNLMNKADPQAIVMHCLPAVRGQEITAEVIDGPQSVVWDQAENRLHAQKAILSKLLQD